MSEGCKNLKKYMRLSYSYNNFRSIKGIQIKHEAKNCNIHAYV